MRVAQQLEPYDQGGCRHIQQQFSCNARFWVFVVAGCKTYGLIGFQLGVLEVVSLMTRSLNDWNDTAQISIAWCLVVLLPAMIGGCPGCVPGV
jgi:hypothetical protein